jgi:uncharacterized membrane protein required for colicin V production
MDATAGPSIGFTPLDFMAVAIVIVGFLLGLRSGFFPQLGGLIGAVAGGAFGLFALPLVRSSLQPMQVELRALIVVCGLIFAVGVGEAIGSAAGRAIHAQLGEGVLGNADRLAGSALGVAQGLLIIWLAGGVLAAGPIPRAAGWAQSSWTVRQLNELLPPPTDIAANLSRLLASSGLPEVFVGLEPFPAPPVDTPTTIEASRIASAAANSTVKVTADACGYELSGTGFSVGRGYFVTNAHVVAGGRRERVGQDDGRDAQATVVLFDPLLDVAVLYTPDLVLPTLRFAPSDPKPATRAAGLGHPLGQQLTVIPVGIAGSYRAEGLDIYHDARVSRDIIELTAKIDKGDSGGPVILADGTVGGVIFAEAKRDDTVGYALSPADVAARTEPAVGRTTQVSTGTCIR